MLHVFLLSYLTPFESASALHNTPVFLAVYEKTRGILILDGTAISSVNHTPRQTAITTVNVRFYQHFNFFYYLHRHV
jgi:hypothetical protein